MDTRYILNERVLPQIVATLCAYELAALAGVWPTISTRIRRLPKVLRLAAIVTLSGGLAYHLTGEGA